VRRLRKSGRTTGPAPALSRGVYRAASPHAIRNALDIARRAQDMHGGIGTSGEFQVMRHMASAKMANAARGLQGLNIAPRRARLRGCV